ncbi:response regulator transcription factor [Bacillus sp. JZ8]
MIKILLVDDHIGVAQGTKAILEKKGEMEVDILGDSKDTFTAIEECCYDILLIDLYMPTLNGLELSKQILDKYPNEKILIYTGFDIGTHFNLLVEAGVVGFISKSAPEEKIIASIQLALQGETVISTELFRQLRRTEVSSAQGTEPIKEPLIRDLTLNEREQYILSGVAEGLTNRELSSELLISQRAVEYILTGIFKKLGVKSRTEALIKATKHSLITVKSL